MTTDQRWVAAQLLLMIAYVLPVDLHPEPSVPGSYWLGMAAVLFGGALLGVALLQLGTSLTPYPTPKRSGELVTTGAYRFARHPIYAGILWTLGGWAIAHHSVYQLIVMGALTVLFWFKSEYEETLLRRHYPTYADYQKRTGRFAPWT